MTIPIAFRQLARRRRMIFKENDSPEMDPLVMYIVVVTEIYANVLLSSELCVELQNGHLVAIQRKISLENGFEVKSEVTSPLNCKPPASNRTLKTLEHVTSANNAEFSRDHTAKHTAE